MSFFRQKWVTALELAKARIVDSEDEEEFAAGRDINIDKQELQVLLKSLVAKQDDLKTCHDLNVKRATALQRSLVELEQIDNPQKARTKMKSINERATLFRITSSAMIKACSEYVTLAHTHGKKWQKLLQHEHESRLRLEEMIEQLAKQHSYLEQRAIKEAAINSPKSPNSDDEEFFDAEETAAEFFVSFPGKAHRVGSSSHTLTATPYDTCADDGNSSAVSIEEDDSTGSDSSECVSNSHLGVVTAKSHRPKSKLSSDAQKRDKKTESVSQDETSEQTEQSVALPESTPKAGSRIRRRAIPERPNQSLNLWSFMKNCIGKELTKIPMPVNFNEPLSMLQRLTEDFEYADLLHRAAKTSDPCEQLTYVAAFCVSHYANSSIRTGKPFNPLLGETYECDRSEDLGWRSVTEQVSHHPPMLAMHVEGRGWKCWSEFSISSKFRGKYLQVSSFMI
jgi:hypothetical protein